MSRNLLPKFILILVLVVAAVLALFPPSKTLKPGIDLAGGTSLIYAIDTEGLSAEEERNLAQRMITVLRRRIDPVNIQNLVWRPQGNTRFEIQMPLASQETRDKREQYEAALTGLLAENINAATIMRALQRAEDLTPFAQGDPNRLEVLHELASVYQERKLLQEQRDALYAQIEDLKGKLTSAGIDLERIEANRSDWGKLDDETLTRALTDFLGSADQLALLTSFIKSYKDLGGALDQLTTEGGLNERYDQAKRQLDRLSLTQEQIAAVLEMPVKSPRRADEIASLKDRFPDRAERIDRVVAVYDDYRPFRGRLDDPMDLRRMLRGAGILQFRIVPTLGRPELSNAEAQQYQEALTEKGPKSGSDSRYVWTEIEKPEEWNVRNSIVGKFGEKLYVLASNQPDEVMLHRPGARDWKLEGANRTSDERGMRAIGFALDIKGGNLFYNITSKNGGRPLAIVLDDLAISAPEINPDRPIRDRGIITGSFTETQVNDMVDKLNAGSLPARLIEQPISERVIGPSIGADNRDRGIKSGLIGLALVMSFMLVYYMIGGSVADVALLLNLLFTLAIMAFVGATFTLPGIAAFILMIGMSVDANVLIFERIREEQEKGMGLSTAIRNGYQRAFSAIFDSNLTTILTAAILYYVASEDVKGFAIVLMLGISSSMFTAIFASRVILEFLASKRLIKDRLLMLRLIGDPHIDWMGIRKPFFIISSVLVIGGLAMFFARDRSKYDIEFTGGTSVLIDLKSDAALTRQDVEDRIVQMGKELNNSELQAASVYSVGEPIGQTPGGTKVFSQYEVTTTATNRLLTRATIPDGGPQTVEAAAATIRKAQTELRRNLGNFEVALDGDKSFVVATSRANPALVQAVLKKAFPNADLSDSEVDEVVTEAVGRAFEGLLAIQQNLEPTITATNRIDEQVIDAYPELANFVGGVKMDVALGTPASLREINERLKDLRFRPDTQDMPWYPFRIFGPDLKPVEPNQPVTTFTFASVEPEAGLRELSDEESERFVANERTRVLAATQRETSLPRVTQIDPFVGSEQKQRALISIVLSLAVIVGYIWLRFGSARYGLAAIAALVHDVSIVLGAVAASALIARYGLGQALLVSDFRINGPMIAAFLTLIGYSLNDTIVVFDRIRENRHKAQLTPQSITNSINQTLSRTVITGATTFIVVLVMYIFGGPGLRGFNFAIGLGLIVGTYSSVAIAAPLLLVGRRTERGKVAKRATENLEVRPGKHGITLPKNLTRG